MLQHLMVVLAATLFYASIIFLIEWVAPVTKRPFSLAGLGLALFAVCAGTLVFDGLGLFLRPPTLVTVAIPGVLGFVALIVLYDFVGYWLHRAQHRWFWRFHAAHHAPRQMRGYIAAIGHPAEAACRYVLVAIPLAIIDIRAAAMPVAVDIFRRFYEFYIHSEVDLPFGPARHIFVDNRFHRLHHGRGAQYVDCNFAIMFSVWDRLFRTAREPADQEWPDVGLDDYLPADSIASFLGHPWSSRKAAVQEEQGRVPA